MVVPKIGSLEMDFLLEYSLAQVDSCYCYCVGVRKLKFLITVSKDSLFNNPTDNFNIPTFKWELNILNLASNLC